MLARYNEGILAQNQGEWDASARIFREIVDSDPSVIEAWNGLGFSLMRLGRLSEAGAAISRALSLSPNYPASLVNEGLLRLQEGRTAESAVLFARAASLDPSNPGPRVNLAIAQGILGNTRDSEYTLTEARRRFPSNPEILYNLGALYEHTGDRERSAETYAAFLSASRGRFPAREEGVRERLRAWRVLP
jgi:Flp pilus assembly protein TadD